MKRRGQATHTQRYCIECTRHINSTTLFSLFSLLYLLTPWCRVRLEKLTGLQLVKKFPAIHRTRRFITALTSVRHLSLSWASPIQSTYPHPTSWRSILMLSTHLRLGLPSGLIQLTYRISTKSVHPIHSFSRDGVVGVATRPRDGRPRNRGSIPGSVRYFSLFSHVQLALKPPTQWVREVVCVCVCVRERERESERS